MTAERELATLVMKHMKLSQAYENSYRKQVSEITHCHNDKGAWVEGCEECTELCVVEREDIGII